ncbi:MAG: hypothetical protein AB1757_06690 [Acidobacteriota bacterium]
MQIQVTKFNGERLRYVTLPDGGILFNTKDVNQILGRVGDPNEQPELDKAGAILLTSGTEFSEFLMREFSGYDDETLVRPRELNWD